MDPYPELLDVLNKMTSHISSLHELQSSLEKLSENFETLAKGKTKIQSNKPAWKIMQSIRGEYQSTTDRIQSILQKYPCIFFGNKTDSSNEISDSS